MPVRTVFIALLGGVILTACSDRAPREDPESIPREHGAASQIRELLPEAPGANVLVVSFDALRADVLGVYGAEHPTSPRINEFAERAVVFDRAYSAAPVTPTSFAAALSARWPHEVFRGWKLEDVPTLAEAFGRHGYQTAAFFNNIQLTDERGFGRGFDRYEVFNMAPEERVLAAATDWLDDSLRSEPEQPFLLWIHFLDPHSPYAPHTEYPELVEEAYRGPFAEGAPSRFEVESPEALERIRSLYRGEVRYADELFGRVLRFLTDRDLDGQTVVVLTTDHGEEFGEHGVFQHQHLYDETTRIPLLVSHPGLERGLRTQVRYSNVDLWPMLARAVGLEPPTGTDGRVPWLADADRTLLSQAMTAGDYRAVLARREEQALLLDCLPTMALSVLDLSPAGMNPASNPDPVARRTLWRGLVGEMESDRPCESLRDAVQGAAPETGLSDETIDGLEGLGYL